MTVMAIYTSGGTIGTYMDLPSFFMTVVGSYLALFTFSSIPGALGIWGTFGYAMKMHDYNQKGVIQALSPAARSS